MNIAIVGFALEGKSSYDYWKDKGNITILDANERVETPNGVKVKSGADYLSNIDDFDLIVRTAGARPQDLIKASGNEDVTQKITTNTNEFFRVCPTKNIIGVTGTKGKGTTSALIAKMLEACGKQTHFGGNIGSAPLNLLKDNIQIDDWIVLELSSFQLVDLNYSPHIGVCLMVVPEHLNWHPDVDSYYKAKSMMFFHQTKDDVAIYLSNNPESERIASSGNGQKIPFFIKPGAIIDDGFVAIDDQKICHVSELGLIGKHNWQNVCAALTAVWQIDKNIKAIKEVLINFKGLEHRLELVETVKGISFYDDSFGTTPETAIVAIEAFDQPKVIILGGSDKGSDYKKLATSIKNGKIRTAVLIGDQGPRIKAALDAIGFSDYIQGGNDMNSIVETAFSVAKLGDVVLLSPACASFDMFANYKDRGDQFKQAVREFALRAAQ